MSADLTGLYKAHKAAKEDLYRARKALEYGIAERLDDAIGILCECQSALCEALSGFSLEQALRDIRDIQRDIQCELTYADPGDAEMAESEVSDDDD